MQYDPFLMRKHIQKLTALSKHEVGGDDWIETAELLLIGFLEDHATPPPLPEPELTLEQKLEQRFGQGPEPDLQPEPPSKPVPGGIQHNTVRDAAIRRVQAKVAAGEEIVRTPAPSLNWAARSQGASISPALLDHNGNPIATPGGSFPG